jgi:hypothetical protein
VCQGHITMVARTDRSRDRRRQRLARGKNKGGVPGEWLCGTRLQTRRLVHRVGTTADLQRVTTTVVAGRHMQLTWPDRSVLGCKKGRPQLYINTNIRKMRKPTGNRGAWENNIQTTAPTDPLELLARTTLAFATLLQMDARSVSTGWTSRGPRGETRTVGNSSAWMLGSTPPWLIVTWPSSRFSSSSLRMAS